MMVHSGQEAVIPVTSDDADWMAFDTAPRDGSEIQARIPGHGDDNVIAWAADSVEDENGSCGTWCFTRDQDPPECWSDGYWWAVNEDLNRSVLPTHWKPLPWSPAHD
jgi:hypothetical protein